MNTTEGRFRDIFFEVYEHLPRQGPGNRECAERALALCSELPASPDIIDLGCGSGGQTLHLASLTEGLITAVDSHAPSIEKLNGALRRLGLSGRVKALAGDISSPGIPAESADLIWSEGALYNIGIGKALEVCMELLRPGGYIAFTDAVWLKENPPDEVKDGFDQDYPEMGRAEDILDAIKKRGFELTGHFTLPDEAWRDDFYTPMEARIKELSLKYKEDTEAAEALKQIAREPEIHRRYSEYYAYEFFVARKPFSGSLPGRRQFR